MGETRGLYEMAFELSFPQPVVVCRYRLKVREAWVVYQHIPLRLSRCSRYNGTRWAICDPSQIFHITKNVWSNLKVCCFLWQSQIRESSRCRIGCCTDTAETRGRGQLAAKCSMSIWHNCHLSSLRCRWAGCEEQECVHWWNLDLLAV